MSITIKDLADLIGIEVSEETKLDELTSRFHNTFIGRKVVGEDPELVRSIVGKRIGSIETAFISSFRELGVELSPEDKKDKKLEDIVRLGFEKVRETTQRKSADLSEPYEKLQKDFVEISEAHKKIREEWENDKKNWNSEMTQFKIDHSLSDAIHKIPFSETIKPFQKDDFKAGVNSKYYFEFTGDGKNIQARLHADDSLVMKVNKSEPESIENVILLEASERGLIKKNNGGQGQIPQKTNYKNSTGINALGIRPRI